MQSVTVLLACANINETLATCSYLQALDGHENIYSFDQGGQVIYYIGKYGVCPAAIKVAPCGFEANGSTMTNHFPNLTAIISVGVASGIKGKVQMYDVLVSSEVVNYDNVLDTDQMYTPKGKPFAVSPWLIKLFSQPAHWPNDVIKGRLINNNMIMPNVMSGMILSGSSYHADDSTINKIFSDKAIGVEMQRAHYFTENTVNAIIIKAVCNFGVGKDNKVYQPTAALLAADLVHVCLSDRQASEKLKGLFT